MFKGHDVVITLPFMVAVLLLCVVYSCSCFAAPAAAAFVFLYFQCFNSMSAVGLGGTGLVSLRSGGLLRGR